MELNNITIRITIGIIKITKIYDINTVRYYLNYS